MAEPILAVRDLTIEFKTREGVVKAVNGVSFDLHENETLGIVGESGSGKSVSVLSLLRLVPEPPARIRAGSAVFEGRDIMQLSERALRRIRGKDISLVFQDPMASLNPVITVGKQLAEMIRAHQSRMGSKKIHSRVVELLELVGIPDATERYKQYPHEYSGGMRQRAMIAMAIANSPKILIADEPTTALDVTIQAQVLRVLAYIREEVGVSTVLITHDLALLAEVADRVLVMYAGKVVEEGTSEQIFLQPRHPYTRSLLDSLPRVDDRGRALRAIGGQPPNLLGLPPGCAFEPRCPVGHGLDRCRTQVPRLLTTDVGSRSACHFPEEVPRMGERGGDGDKALSTRRRTDT